MRNNLVLLVVLAAAIVAGILAHPIQLSAQTEPAKSNWSLQVDKINSGDVSLAPSFQIAIYENLVDELSKTKEFNQVFRDGDRDANKVSDLLILKTTVLKYTAGSETQRAVTTVSGATKLTVRTQLCTRDEAVLIDRRIDDNVRFMGSNLRATHNLARNVAKAIQQSSLSAPAKTAAP